MMINVVKGTVEVKRSSIASEIECMGLKPYWVGDNIECLCKNCLVLTQINFLRILEKVERIEMVIAYITFIPTFKNKNYFGCF